MPNQTNNSSIDYYHGTYVSVFGIGILLTGESGAGKSQLALELIERGHQLISDDSVEFFGENKQIIGQCPRLLQSYLNIYEIGVINIEKIFGTSAILAKKSLQLIIELQKNEQYALEKREAVLGRYGNRLICGTEVPFLTISNIHNRPGAVLVETVVKDFQLRKSGYNAGIELVNKQKRELSEF